MGAFYNYKPHIIMCASYNYKPRITGFDFFLDYYGSKVSLAFNCVILVYTHAFSSHYYGSKVSLAFNCVILYSSAVHRI